MFPLIFYIVLRWREIEKYCRQIGHPAYFLKGSRVSYETYTNFNIQDNWAQPTHFSPKVITVYKNVPYFRDDNNYLKDISCQTEQATCIDKGIQKSEPTHKERERCIELTNEKSSSVCPALLDTISISTDVDKRLFQEAASTPIDKKCLSQAEKLCDNTEFSFLSNENSSNKIGWRDIVKETADTVKKVEEYIYDDYDTFSKEEYNQISDGNKSKFCCCQRLISVLH